MIFFFDIDIVSVYPTSLIEIGGYIKTTRFIIKELRRLRDKNGHLDICSEILYRFDGHTVDGGAWGFIFRLAKWEIIWYAGKT